MLATLGFWSVTLTRLHAAIRKGQGFVTWDFKSQRRCASHIQFEDQTRFCMATNPHTRGGPRRNHRRTYCAVCPGGGLFVARINIECDMQMSISLSLIIFTGCANNRNQQTCTLQVHGPPSCVSGFTTANFVPWSYCAVMVVGQQVVVVVDQLEHQKLEACPSDMS